MLSQKEGKLLLKFARDSVFSILFDKKLVISNDIKKLNQKVGVFVTIHKEGVLRGCIGFVVGAMPLFEAVKKVAYSAAFEDPRFMPVEKDEWDLLDFEISVLTVPEVIQFENREELPDKIKVGEDGLIVEQGPYSGLLLPQVAPEWNWNSTEFLEHTCEKADLPFSAWKEDRCVIKKFQAQVFSED